MIDRDEDLVDEEGNPKQLPLWAMLSIVVVGLLAMCLAGELAKMPPVKSHGLLEINKER